MQIEFKNGHVYIDGELETDPTLLGFHLLDLAEEVKEGVLHDTTP